jgi:hypothetical protein
MRLSKLCSAYFTNFLFGSIFLRLTHLGLYFYFFLALPLGLIVNLNFIIFVLGCYYFAHHKSHMSRPWFEPGPPRWEASD